MLEARVIVKGHLSGSKSSSKKLIYALNSSGPVILKDGHFIFQPEGYVPRHLIPIVTRLESLCDIQKFDSKSKQKLIDCITNINSQITAINAGEQAANAKLAQAIDSLNPTMDYYSY